MKKQILFFVSLWLCSLPLMAQKTTRLKQADQRWIIRPEAGYGYTFGKIDKGWGSHYGARILFNAKRTFLGGTVMFGGEYLMMDAHSNEGQTNPIFEGNPKYIVLAPMFEQNYKLLKNGFSISSGVGYYIGIQAQPGQSLGMITNIAWSPLTSKTRIKPYISYRNDMIFDKNRSQTHGISVGLNL